MIKKPPHVNISCLCESWPKSDIELWVRDAIGMATQFFDEDFEHTEMSVVFSSDAHIRELNHDFRGKDKPTNVLSFEGNWDEDGSEIGDVLLAYETVLAEAQEADISLKDHTIHLIIHGFLHLLGYDHDDDEEAEEMESLEIEILEKLNISNPYTEDF